MKRARAPYNRNHRSRFALSGVVGLAGALAIVNAPALAGAASSTEDLFSLSVEELARITVTTASWAPQSARDTPASVSVITAEQIRAMGARTVYEVLRHVPGLRVDFNQRMRPIISIRGTRRENGNHLLFLLDGHSMNDTMANSASFLPELTRVPIHNIERIEVLRGAGSARFGSSALAGVVNIITRDASGPQRTELSFRQEFDADGSVGREYNMLHAGRLDSGVGVALNLNVQDRSGEHLFVPNEPGLPNQPNNRFDQIDLQGKLDFGATRINARFVSQDRGEHYGVFYWLSPDDELDFDSLFFNAETDARLAPQIKATARAYYQNVDGGLRSRVSLSPAIIGIRVPGYKYGMELRATDSGFDRHLITYGVLAERQALSNPRQLISGICDGPPDLVPESCADNDDVSRDLYALFAEDIWRIDEDLTINLGVRYDNYSDFGSSLNPRAGVNWRLNDELTLRVNYGTAFQAPDFRSLYSQIQVVKGNPDLTEESMTSFDVGLSWQATARLGVTITGFYNELDNLIVSTTGSDRFRNAGTQNNVGLELEARYDLGDLGYLSANYAYVDAEVGDCCALTDEPRHSGSVLAALRLWPGLDAGLSLYWQGESPRAPADPRPDLGGYVKADANLRYQLLSDLELELAVFNLFDQDYAWPAPIGTRADDLLAPGRSFMLGVRYHPQ